MTMFKVTGLAAMIFAASLGPAGAAPEGTGIEAVDLPGAPADGVSLDYLAVDDARHRVWVPAGGTGKAVVIDAKSREVRTVDGLPTTEVERRGKKRMVGPSSATIGDGFVYVGNRADSSVCAIDAATLARAGCVTLPSMPDGLAFLSRTKEVWATTPRDQTITILDVSKPSEPKIAGSLKLEGDPEGYAVDDAHGIFYTNLEDKDRTLRIDVRKRKVTATWQPGCGESGPRGLAIDSSGKQLVVACTDRVEVLDTAKDGRILSKLETGDGVDAIAYSPGSHSVYVASGGTAMLTVAAIDAKGVLRKTSATATAPGARNAVVTEDGTAFVADGRAGKILVVRAEKAR